MHVDDLLSTRALLTPARLALSVVHEGRHYTYAELNARACRCANLLREQYGVQEGDRVAILAHNGIAYVDLLFGLAKIGAIFTPLNWRLTGRELSYIVSDAQPRIVICGPEFTGVLAEIQAEQAGSSGSSLEAVISLEGAAIPGAASYEALLESASPDEPVRPVLDGEDPLCILYTSGTTGKPKGAVIPHRQVLWNAINTVISWGLSERDISPILTPMFHAGGLFIFLVPLFYAGGRIILARNFDPEASLRMIVAEQCTAVLGVPTLFQMWMNTPYFAEADFSHVHFFVSGGAPCPLSLMQAWREAKGVVFRQGYGLTEVGTNCFSMTDEESVIKAGSVGKPIFHSRMRLVDARGQDVPVGQTGELIIAGPHVCSGYWRNPTATAQVLQDGWFHTGDMARQDADGFYYIAGRYKDMIISGGENVYAAEVEAVFREHPAVADAALIGQPDPKWGEVGLMVVALKPDHAARSEELLVFCAGRLARFKIPKRIEFLPALPTSPYGKVIKSELRKMFLVENTGAENHPPTE